MFIRLPDYRLGHRFVSFARSEEVAARLGEYGLDCLLLAGDELEHHPSAQRFPLDDRLREDLATCVDFDVFEVEESGRAFRCYSGMSDDNVVFITGRCNSACVMCPDPDTLRAKAPIRDVSTLLEQVRYIPSDAPHLTITGGEPFMLGEGIFTLFGALRDKFEGTEFLLLTNGRIFSVPSYVERTVLSLPPRTTIGIPIHGYDARTHDSITRVSGSFDQTVSGLKRLLELGSRVELRVVVSKISATYMPQLADLIVREFKGVSCVKIIGLEMLGNAAVNADDIWIPYRAAFESCKSAIVKLVDNGIDVGLYNLPLCSVEEAFWPICEKSISDYKVRFVEECNRCQVKDACGGVFSGTRRFAMDDIKALGRPRL